MRRRVEADGRTTHPSGPTSKAGRTTRSPNSAVPNSAASIHPKRAAGIKGDLDHFGAANFLVGLLTILRDSGFPGLVLVLDEVETCLLYTSPSPRD